jgi:hypothetical protein
MNTFEEELKRIKEEITDYEANIKSNLEINQRFKTNVKSLKKKAKALEKLKERADKIVGG